MSTLVEIHNSFYLRIVHEQRVLYPHILPSVVFYDILILTIVYIVENTVIDNQKTTKRRFIITTAIEMNSPFAYIAERRILQYHIFGIVEALSSFSRLRAIPRYELLTVELTILTVSAKVPFCAEITAPSVCWKL